MLSGYKIMWMYVMFDLPVGTKQQRTEATKFRNELLNYGFKMAQFSIYAKFFSGKEVIERVCKDIEPNIPKGGSVDILCFTDKQYENIIRYEKKIETNQQKKKSQLTLF